MNYEPEEEQENTTPGWMVTYGDMVTLLLVFFVLLFSFSAIDTVVFRDILTSMKGSLSVLSGGKMVVSPEDMPDYQVKPGGPDIEKMTMFMENLRRFIEEQEMAEQAQVIMNEQGIVLSLKDMVLFARGSASLTTVGEKVLGRLYPLIDIFPNEIEVTGHTDRHPVRRGSFKSNWDLSGARAIAVVKYYTGRNPQLEQRFTVTAYSSNRPVSTAPGEQDKNRRIEIIFKKL